MERKLNLFFVIKNLCTDHNITIAQLERNLGFSEGSISKWKSSIPSINKLLTVANYFNVSLDFLAGRTILMQMAESILSDINFISILVAYEQMDNTEKEKMMMLLKLSFQDKFKF